MARNFTLFLLIVGAFHWVISASATEQGGLFGPTPEPVAAVQDSYPDLHPQLSRVFFQSNRSGTSQIWSMNLDGSGLMQVTRSVDNDTSPVISPNGSQLLFVSDRPTSTTAPDNGSDGKRSIYLIELDETGRARGPAKLIVSGPTTFMHPEWTPDGRGFIYNRIYPDDDGSDLVHYDFQTGKHTVLDFPRRWNTYASVSPDGSRLLYRPIILDEEDESASGNSEIVVALPNGSESMRIASHPAFDGWPDWSPDGKRIAFSSNREGAGYQLYIVNLDGTHIRQLTDHPHYQTTQPDWSADGEKIVAYRWSLIENGSSGHLVTISPD